MTAHAALQLLQDPFVSYGAAPLVRTMVECWAFSHHIQRGGPGVFGAQDTCRALALELGMMRQRSKNFTELFGELLQSSAEPRATHAAIQKALKDIDELYQRHGCTCPVTNWTAVRSVLDELRSNHGSLAKQIWLECSMDAHAHAPDRMYRKIGETVTMGAPATYQFRFRMLNYVATAIFYQIAATFMCLAAYRRFFPEDYLNVRARFERVRRNQTARDARAGKHDVPA